MRISAEVRSRVSGNYQAGVTVRSSFRGTEQGSFLPSDPGGEPEPGR